VLDRSHQSIGAGDLARARSSSSASAAQAAHQKSARCLTSIEFFGKRERDQVVVQIGIAADGDRQALEQRGLAGAAQAHQQVVLDAADARSAREFVAQEKKSFWRATKLSRSAWSLSQSGL
jgi:hypothetical protein